MEPQTGEAVALTTMRAVVHERYGPPEVLRVAEVPRPAPGSTELLVEVRATTVNRTDCGFRAAKPFIVRPFSGMLRPKRSILGTEFAGVVRAVGDRVDGFAPGDRVFGVHADHFGAHAEYLCVDHGSPVATMPEGLSFDEAAAVGDGALLALSYLRWVECGPGQRLLVYGASGSIGTAAVQLAHHLGAKVTAVCGTANLDLVHELGAYRVIDYTAEDFTKRRERYDVILDAVGKLTFGRCKVALQKDGTYVSADLGPWGQNLLLSQATPLPKKRKVRFPIPKYNKADLETVKGLVEAGEYRPVIDRRYPLDDVVEATRYVETEQKVGNVVLTVGGPS